MTRLTRCIREVPHYPLAETTLVTRFKTVNGRQEQIQRGDPWIQRLAEAGMKNTEYLSMIHSIEAGTNPTNLPNKYELQKTEGFWGELSIFTLSDGKTLVLKMIKRLLCQQEKEEI